MSGLNRYESLGVAVREFLATREADYLLFVDGKAVGVVDDAMVTELKSALQPCAAWHKTPQVVVRYAAKPGLAKRLSD